MESTLLLRFRDLSCPQGETINRHNEIINANGYVWWGWWNKGHEKLPIETITELRLKSRVTGKYLYLFDSSQKKFYKATLDTYHTDIEESSAPPERKYTPNYYADNTHPIWFKFTKIEEIPSTDIIGNKSYKSMKDLFSEESHYEMYDNKVVASSEELTEQNRTIWRIRDKTNSDKTNEIRLRGMTELQPRHFDKLYNATKKDSILWLSDPHFTKNHFHGYALEDDLPKNTLAKTIQSAYFNSGHNIASLLISGDFTWKGDTEEFDLASKFIDYLCSVNNLDKSWLAICPGNHDLSFYKEADHADKVNDDIIKQNYEISRAAYSEFYSKFFDIKPNKSMSSGRRLLLNSSIPVEIVLLNSVTLQQTEKSFQGHGYIGQEQLEEVTKEMNFCKNQKPRNVTRICVMHHHLLPVSLSQEATYEGNYSTVLDAERLARWLTEHEFDFLLHGHMHQNFYCAIERSLITHRSISEINPSNKLHILSLGSSGVCESHTGETKGNWVCRIEFSNKNIIFHYSKISPDDATLESDNYKLEFNYNA